MSKVIISKKDGQDNFIVTITNESKRYVSLRMSIADLNKSLNNTNIIKFVYDKLTEIPRKIDEAVITLPSLFNHKDGISWDKRNMSLEESLLMIRNLDINEVSIEEADVPVLTGELFEMSNNAVVLLERSKLLLARLKEEELRCESSLLHEGECAVNIKLHGLSPIDLSDIVIDDRLISDEVMESLDEGEIDLAFNEFLEHEKVSLLGWLENGNSEELKVLRRHTDEFNFSGRSDEWIHAEGLLTNQICLIDDSLGDLEELGLRCTDIISRINRYAMALLGTSSISELQQRMTTYGGCREERLDLDMFTSLANDAEDAFELKSDLHDIIKDYEEDFEFDTLSNDSLLLEVGRMLDEIIKTSDAWDHVSKEISEKKNNLNPLPYITEYIEAKLSVDEPNIGM